MSSPKVCWNCKRSVRATVQDIGLCKTCIKEAKQEMLMKEVK